MTTIKDMFDRDVNVGDNMAVAFRVGNSSELRLGVVTGFSARKGSYGGPDIDLIEIEWVEASGYGDPPVKSKVEARTKRFMVVQVPA